MKLKGINAIISGGSQGLGLAVAEQFVKQGANLMLCARNLEPLQTAQNFLKNVSSTSHVHIMQADVARMDEVDALIQNTLSTFGQIDCLIANAGIYGTKGAIDEIDWQAWSDAIDINLKGTVLQCRAVLPHFKQNKKGKIIILSGGGATKPMPYLSAYAASKAAVVRFAETLALEVQDYHIDVNTIAPGALNTRLLTEIVEAGPEKVGQAFYAQALKQQAEGGTPLTLGAELCAFLASAESDGITGKLISAVWDPWKQLPDYIQDLHKSDVYTLRRIVPEDRNLKWEKTE